MTPWVPYHHIDPDEEAELRADARRWRYVRDHLVRSLNPRMDVTFTYRFQSPNGRGRSIEEVIDKLIADSGEAE